MSGKRRAHAARQLKVPARFDLELDASVALAQALLDDAQRSRDRVLNPDTDAYHGLGAWLMTRRQVTREELRQRKAVVPCERVPDCGLKAMFGQGVAPHLRQHGRDFGGAV